MFLTSHAFSQYYNVTRLPSAVFTTGHATNEISNGFPYHQATCPAHIMWNYLVPKSLHINSTSHRGTTWVLLNKNVAFNQNTVTQGETPMHRFICIAVPSSLSHGHTTCLCLSPSTTCFTHDSTFSRWHPLQTSHCLARPTLLQITELYVMHYSDNTPPIICMTTFRNNRQ